MVAELLTQLLLTKFWIQQTQLKLKRKHQSVLLVWFAKDKVHTTEPKEFQIDIIKMEKSHKGRKIENFILRNWLSYLVKKYLSKYTIYEYPTKKSQDRVFFFQQQFLLIYKRFRVYFGIFLSDRTYKHKVTSLIILLGAISY